MGSQRQKKGCIGCLAVVVILVAIALIQAALAPPGVPPERRHPGAIATLRAGDAENAMLAVDETAYDEMLKASIAGDSVGLRQMVLSGRVELVPNNTRILVIDRGLYRRKVRIMEGAAAGIAGWVAEDWVQ